MPDWPAAVARSLRDAEGQLGASTAMMLLRRVVGQTEIGRADEMTRLLVEAMAAQYGANEVVRRYELTIEVYLDFAR